MVLASTGVAVMGSFAYGVAVSLSSASYLLFFPCLRIRVEFWCKSNLCSVTIYCVYVIDAAEWLLSTYSGQDQ
jgi:hypothetical protein